MSLKLFALLAWISLGIFEGVAAQNDGRFIKYVSHVGCKKKKLEYKSLF